MSDPQAVSVVDAKELVRRIEYAKQLRAEGADESVIAEYEPTQDEMRAILLELRQGRTEINEAAKKSKKAPKQPKTLDSLLSTPLK